MERKTFWDIMFHVGLSMVLLWYFLKSFGIINTPFYLNYGLPTLGAVLTVLSIYHNFLQPIYETKGDVRELKADIKYVTKRVDHLEKDMHVVTKDINLLKTDMAQVKTKLHY